VDIDEPEISDEEVLVQGGVGTFAAQVAKSLDADIGRQMSRHLGRIQRRPPQDSDDPTEGNSS
jgi:hypothetical protein